MSAIEDHVAAGRRLIEEAKRRYNYWLMTDCVLPGEKEFERKCRAFNERASQKVRRGMQMPSLDDIRTLDEYRP